MGKKDPRVDAYIAKSARFAQPILSYFRELMHNHCPDVIETIKWGFPNFEYKGPLSSIASFKEHCAISFWKAAIMIDAQKLKQKQEEGMGHLGRIKSKDDLPKEIVLLGYIKEAIQLNEDGIKLPAKPKSTAPKEIIIPTELSKVLIKNKKAKQHFDAFSPYHKKEYIQWITEAKTDLTRNKRLASTVEMLSEGKTRMWKYQQK